MRGKSRNRRPGQSEGYCLAEPLADASPLGNFAYVLARLAEVGGTGLEPPPKSSGFPGYLPEGGAESGAIGAQNGPIDPELAEVVRAWPTLPPVVKGGIMAMVRAQNG